MTGRRRRRFSSQNLLATSYTGKSMSTNVCYPKFRRDVPASGPWGSDKLEVFWRKGLRAWVKL